MSIKAWYRDELEGDPGTPHLTDPPQYLEPEELYRKTGVKYEKIPDFILEDGEALERLPKERECKFHDYVELNIRYTPDYEAKLSKIWAEHLHDDSEIRLFLDGGGFFEMRTRDEKWVRVHVQKGDLLDLPPGLWHRFCFDERQYFRQMRLYKDTTEWSAEYRHENPNPAARERYRNTMEHISKLQAVRN